MSKKTTKEKNAPSVANTRKLPGEDLDFGSGANENTKYENTHEEPDPDFILNLQETTETKKPVNPSVSKKAHSFPKVPKKDKAGEKPKTSPKMDKARDKTPKPSSKEASKNIKENDNKGESQSVRVDATAAVDTTSEPVNTQKNKVKNNNKSAKENKDKKKGNSVKPKADTKKKDKHKPFRRGHDIDLDSKVKSEFFSMRLSGKELETLSKKAAKAHMSTSTYARETLLSSVPREALSEKEKIAMDKAYTMLEDANFNVRQMSNYFHSLLSEKDKDGKEKYERLTWKELKIVLKKMKPILDFLDNEFRIYK